MNNNNCMVMMQRTLAMIVVALVLATAQPTSANFAPDGVKCDSGSGFGMEAGECPMECGIGSDLQATMTTKNGDPNRWVHAAVNCGGGSSADTCPGASSCATPPAKAVSEGAGWCHGKVANEKNDWYRWSLYCAVGPGEHPASDNFNSFLGQMAPTVHLNLDGGPLSCDDIEQVGAQNTPGVYILVEGTGLDFDAISYGDGGCTSTTAVVTFANGVLSVFA